jgi:endonuclease IV
LNILQDANDYSFFKKQEEIFNTTDRHKKFKNSTLAKPLFKDLSIKYNLNSLPIIIEHSISNTNLQNQKKINNIYTENNVYSL